MTDEERQKLCEELRTATPGNVTVKSGYRAADEIERLANWARESDRVNDQLRSEIGGLRSEIERLNLELREAERVFASMEKEINRMSWNYAGRRND
jgi:septal ring factor EnvC (AmiA/AmiB activator)